MKKFDFFLFYNKISSKKNITERSIDRIKTKIKNKKEKPRETGIDSCTFAILCAEKIGKNLEFDLVNKNGQNFGFCKIKTIEKKTGQ